MTHYTVLIIGNNIEGKLIPYNENLIVKPYIYKRKGEIIATKRRLEMDKDHFRKVTPMSYIEFYKYWYGDYELDTYGNILTTYNPDSKWDWYEIGGRWQGMLKLKDGAKGIHGKAAYMLKDHKYIDNCVDQARFCDIDWITMKRERIRNRHNEWNKELTGKDRFFAFHMLNTYGTMENYINTSNHLTYAVITEDGQWYAPGEMGWFGCSSESHEESQKWNDKYWDTFLADLSPDTLITIVDCHI